MKKLKKKYEVKDILEVLNDLHPATKQVGPLDFISYTEQGEERVVTYNPHNRKVTFSVFANSAKERMKDMVEESI